MSTAPFVELAAQSCFSFLRGASHPEEIVTRSLELGLSGVGLCDRDGLYGAARAFACGKDLGQVVFVGAAVPLALPQEWLRELFVPNDAGRLADRSASPYRKLSLRERRQLGQRAPENALRKQWLVEDEFPLLLLLARTQTGYKNLCGILTRAHAHVAKGECLLAVEELDDHVEGLTALIPAVVCDHHWSSSKCSEVGSPSDFMPPALLEQLVDRFEPGQVYSLVCRRLDGVDPQREEIARRRKQHCGLPIVASGWPLFHHARRREIADVLQCIRLGKNLDELHSRLLPNSQAFLRGPREMNRLFSGRPDWLEASARIASEIHFGLGDLSYQFPCRAPAGETPDEYLERLCREGAKRRYPAGAPAKVEAQIGKELELIRRMKVAPYFLSTWEVVEIARERNILCQGRGSAANSAVCYCLGVTAVDPARSNLLFERFMSEERTEPPDIDVDFEHERREEVIQELYRRHGRDRAAMVSEVIRYRRKSALRDVAKAFGFSLPIVERIVRAFSNWPPSDESANSTKQRFAQAKLDGSAERVHKCLELSAELEGFPRHLGIHVGGFVLSSAPLYEVAPVEPARMVDRTVIPWDKDDLDTLGFFKIDVLALGMLTAIRKSLCDVWLKGELRDPRYPEERFDPLEVITRVPPEDPHVYALTARADTVGVFQIESRAQMAMLPRLRPQCFYDLVIEVAIVRPGPIQGGMVHPYLRRRNREEAPDCHPLLQDILRRTLGVPLFQEQVMQIAIVGAGYTGGEADQLRRDMAAWKKSGRLLRHRERLLEGFARRGIDRAFGEALFEQIKGFGEYGFPESHAASFALLVYKSLWLKAHHPAEFLCALLNSQPMGFYSPGSLVKDAQKHGVAVLPVCALSSEWDCSLVWPSGASLGAAPARASGTGESSTGGHCGQMVPGKASSTSAASKRPPPKASSTSANSIAAESASTRAPLGLPETRLAGMPSVRLGFRMVQGLQRASGSELIQQRNQRQFESLSDLECRLLIPRRDLELLAEAGAFKLLQPARRQALWSVKGKRAVSRHGQLELFNKPVEKPPVLLPRLSRAELLALDYRRVRLSLEDHPMRHLRHRLEGSTLTTQQLQSCAMGQRVRVAGLVLSRQRPATASGVVFITLEDEFGIANLVLYRRVFEAFRPIAQHSSLLIAFGRVERQDPNAGPQELPFLQVEGAVGSIIHLIVESLEGLAELPSGPLHHRSRDFR